MILVVDFNFTFRLAFGLAFACSSPCPFPFLTLDFVSPFQSLDFVSPLATVRNIDQFISGITIVVHIIFNYYLSDPETKMYFAVFNNQQISIQSSLV